MLRLFAIGLRALAAIFRLFPLKRRVAFLSRQSKVPSADFRLLETRLRELDPTLPIVIHTIDSELSGKVRFAFGMLAQLKLACTSQVIILDGYNPVVSIPPKRAGIYVIQLWHAAGALKKFGFQCLDTPAGRTREQARIGCMHRNYDLIVAAGVGAIDAYAEAFGYPREVIKPYGLPRIDLLLQGGDAHRAPDAAQSDALRSQHPWLSNGNLNVLYAPTLRKGACDSWLSTNVMALAQALSDAPVNLIVSKHPLTTIDIARFSGMPHVNVLSHHSTTSLMRVADVVITDYSAIALEAGLIGIPVLFYVPDITAYRRSPGLNIDPLTHPQLVGSEQAESLADVLTNRRRLEDVRRRYQAFIATYYNGVTPHATDQLAHLVLHHLKS